jgi:rod shape-determining protein MreD
MKTILFFPVFYTISLLQTSFLVHFNFFGVIIPYITIIIVLLLNIFEKPDKKYGIYGAGILGFFWDIFSTAPIGFHLLFLAGLAFLIKILLKNYFQPVIRLSLTL